MQINTSIILSVISLVICILSFYFSRKGDTKKDVSDESYRWGSIDEKLKTIFEKLEKIELKLDGYDKELDERITKAIANHEKIYHNS